MLIVCISKIGMSVVCILKDGMSIACISKLEGVCFFKIRVGGRAALRISLVFAFYVRIGDRAVLPRLRRRTILLTLSL